MKRFFMSAAVMLLAAMAVANAQPHHRCGQDWRDRVRSERVAFLTAEMNLTPAEAEDFWPVYNRIQQERRDAQKEIMEAYKSLEALVDEGVSGKAMAEATDRYLAAIGQKNKVCGKGYEELMKVLPPDKVAKMFVAEERFRRDQIHRLHHDDGPVPARPGHHRHWR